MLTSEIFEKGMWGNKFGQILGLCGKEKASGFLMYLVGLNIHWCLVWNSYYPFTNCNKVEHDKIST